MTRTTGFTFVFILVLGIVAGGIVNPLYGETYQLKNKIEIKDLITLGVDDDGGDGNDPYLFFDIYRVTFDGNGNLYVLDGKANCVKVFDQNGKFLTKHFSAGQGPKEIANPANMAVNKFNDHIFVLQNYGFTLKEFDPSGECVKSHPLPQQFFHSFGFIQKNKLLYMAFNSKNKKSFDSFKLLNTDTGKIEKSFGQIAERDDSHRSYARFTIVDNTVWLSPGKHMVLQGYDLTTGKKIKEIKIPGDYKANDIKTQKIEGGHSLTMIFFNTAQVFSIDGKVFVLSVLQDYKKEKDSYETYPFKTRHKLWLLEGDLLVELGDLKGLEHMFLEHTWKNRVVLHAPLPFPRIKVIEINTKYEQVNRKDNDSSK